MGGGGGEGGGHWYGEGWCALRGTGIVFVLVTQIFG